MFILRSRDFDINRLITMIFGNVARNFLTLEANQRNQTYVFLEQRLNIPTACIVSYFSDFENLVKKL